MSTKSIGDLKRQYQKKYKTTEQTYNDFRVGTKVQVITPCSDFFFFRCTERGVITENKGGYYGLKVVFDEPLHIEGGGIMTHRHFNPVDLRILGRKLKKDKICSHCGK